MRKTIQSSKKISQILNKYQPLTSNFFNFSKQKRDDEIISSSIGGMNFKQQNKRLRMKNIQQYKRNLPMNKLQNFISAHMASVTLYMEHDSIESQYIFNMLNIQHLGFKRISDYAILNQSYYALNLRDKKLDKYWPTLKFAAPVSEPIIITGADNIYKFLDEQGLIKFQIDMQINQTLKTHIDQKIIPSLQLIFLHPRLTFEQYLHIDVDSFPNAVNQAVVGSLTKNFRKITTKTIKNLIKIMKNKAEYENSKQAFTKAIKELEFYFSEEKPFIGGQNPSYMDIYLYSILCTRTKSNHFLNFLKEDIGGKVFIWFNKMKWATAYDKERVTLV